MVSKQELLAALSYNAYTPSAVNAIAVAPLGWVRDAQLSKNDGRQPAGFGADVWRNPSTNEIVVAFRGTDGWVDIDWLANFSIAQGIKAGQMRAAIELMSNVLNQYPNSQITLTGHSLGGGIANVIGMFFDLDSYTFATAGFDRTARGVVGGPGQTEIPSGLVESYYRDYQTYQQQTGNRPLNAAFTAYRDAFAQGITQGNAAYASRLHRLDGVYIDGEVNMSERLALGPDTAARVSPLPIGVTTFSDAPFVSPEWFVDARKLHYIGLHAAVLLSPTLRQASASLPTLIELIRSTDLYARDPSPPDGGSNVQDFLSVLLRDAYDPTKSVSESKLGRFAADALHIAGTNRDQRSTLIDALIKATIEYYYFSSVSDTTPFVADAGGTQASGVRIDLGRIVIPPTAVDRNARASLIDGALASLGALQPLRAAALPVAQKARFWTVQNTNLGLISQGTTSNDVIIGSITQQNNLSGDTGSDLLVGGTLADTLSGGTDADVIYGSDGIDTLNGGAGDDQLFGGAGKDVYSFMSGDGVDTIFDADGGEIFINGVKFTGATLIHRSLNEWSSASGDVTVKYKPGAHNTVEIEDRAHSVHLNVELASLGSFDLALPATPLPTAGSPGDVIGNDVAGGGGGNAFAPGFPSLRAGPRDGRALDRPVATLSGVWPPDTIANGDGTSRSYLGMDNLRGTTGDNNMFGLGGNDSLEGLQGDDFLDGGDGSDMVVGGLGRDILIGGLGDDILLGDEQNTSAGFAIGGTEGNVYQRFNPNYQLLFNGLGWGYERSPSSTDRTDFVLYGLGGGYFGGDADSIDAGDGNDDVFAGDGNDDISGGAGNDYLDGDAGDDFIDGGDGDDRIIGDGQQDDFTDLLNFSLITAFGRDSLYGGAGNDRIVGYGNADVLYGDEGDDELYGDGFSDTVLGAADYGGDFMDGGDGDDTLIGQGGNDTLIGGADDDTLDGDGQGFDVTLHGDDSLDGGDGADFLIGNGGSDVLQGGAGADRLFGDADNIDGAHHGNDRLDGGSESDLLVGGGGNDLLLGGDGNDDLRGDQGLEGLAGQYQGIDVLDGGAGDDTLVGGGAADTLIGGDGADTILGDDGTENTPVEFDGDDSINAGAGDDHVFGQGGNDVISGGDGADILVGDDAAIPASAHGNDTIMGDAGNDVIFGQGGADTLLGGDGDDELQGDDADVGAPSGNDYLDGGLGNDLLLGRAGADTLIGSGGDDQISGGEGDDYLDGGQGNDVLDAGAGNDTLYGGEGSDTLQGGAGDDTYVFDELDLQVNGTSIDTIFDAEGNNRVVFQGGVLDDDVTLLSGSIAGSIVITQGSDLALSVRDALNGGQRSYQFADGKLVAANEFIGRAYHTTVNSSSTADGSYLLAGTENDTLTATGQLATLSGGRGNDTLSGAADKKTTYLLEAGDGQDTISDAGNRTVSGEFQTNTLSFGAGITSAGIQLEYDTDEYTLRIKYDGGADSVRLSGFEAWDVVNERTIDEVKFADGTTQTWAQLVAQHTINVVGTNWYRDGTNVDDLIVGSAQDETLYGGRGNDTLDGGAGNDALQGWYGNDTYRFGLGSGVDSIDNTGLETDFDRLEFGAGLTLEDVLFFQINDDLVVRIAGAADQLTISSWFSGLELDEMRFADGTVITPATLVLSDPSELATEGNDQIFGTASDDVIDSLGGNDVIHGAGGNDTLTGGSGGDSLYGEAGNDTLFGGVDNDFLDGGDGDDILNDLAGDNDLYGQAGNDTLTGNGYLDGGDGNDSLTGGTPDDQLAGGNGNDTLTGAGGNDTLDGGNGDDTYVYALGDGTDFIAQFDNTAGKTDTLRFAAGILPQNVIMSASTLGDLLITFRDNNGATLPGSITIERFFAFTGPEKVVDRIVFDDAPGTVLTRAAIDALVMAPTSGSDYIRGSDSADTLDGLAGNDTIRGMGGNDVLFGGDGADRIFGGDGDDELHSGTGTSEELNGEFGNDTLYAEANGVYRGGAGSDTYVITRNWLTPFTGFVAIDDQDAAPTSTDVLRFAAGTLPANLKVRAGGFSGKDLELSVLYPPTGSYTLLVRVVNYFDPATANRLIDEVRFTDDPGTVWNLAQLQQLTLVGTDANETLVGFDTNDTLTGAAGNDSLQGGLGNDDLDGGTGRDQLEGGGGDDVYRFALGYSTDEILDTSGTDRVEVAAGITPAQVSLIRTSTRGLVSGASSPPLNVDSLAIVVNGGTDQLLVEGYYAAGGVNAIEQIHFADGTTWNAADIAARVVNQSGTANAMTGTSGADTFTVDHPDDTVSESAGGGTDLINASVSYSLPNNVENLTLTGTLALRGTGNSLANVITGNSASNDLNGFDGIDTLIGGAGDDNYTVDGPELGGMADTVTENANEGFDTIFGKTDGILLPANVERFVLTGYASNFSTTRSYVGNALDNVIEINAGSSPGDIAIIDGGAGADTLIGGQDLNVYRVDNVGDVVFERDTSNGGAQSTSKPDRVETSVNYVLPFLVEDMTLTGSAAITGTGNTYGNKLNSRQNSAANTLIGGLGDDYYVIDAGDSIVESTGEGTDTVETDFTYTIGANLEVLRLTGSVAINGTGNGLDNDLWGSTSSAVNVLTGGAGNDTYHIGANDTVVESASGGTDTVLVDFSYTLGANVENGQLNSSNFTLTGNELDNHLTGHTSSDTLIGGAGNDVLETGGTLRGGSGADTYLVGGSNVTIQDTDTGQLQDSAVDVVNFTSTSVTAQNTQFTRGVTDNRDLIVTFNSGLSTLTAKGFFASGSAVDRIEQFHFADGTVLTSNQILTMVLGDVVFGTEGPDTLNAPANGGEVDGLGGNDTLNGSAFNDVLDGGTGADTMIGNAGDDQFVVDDAGDVVQESAGGGTDLVRSSVSFALSANVESLTLTDSANVNATGNALGNQLVGNSGNNVLDGGTGNDTMTGGLGDDSYVIDSLSDIVVENAGEGRDAIRAAFSYTLNVANLEDLVLIGTADINGTGSSVQNTITGNSGANVLDGGAGLDTLIGGAGDDSYYVSGFGEVVQEAAGEGFDTVYSNADFQLSADVEKLVLLEDDFEEGSNAIGNALNNVLIGNSFQNMLDGGAGADHMEGGEDNDTYIVDDVGDEVVEAAGEGTDTVSASVSYTLGANVENLTLTGSANINGTGNSGANTIIGNSGNNVLDGGTGTDSLQGGAGNDTYILDSASDTITEGASAGTDTVQAGFTYTLGTNLENLTLTGTGAFGGTGNGSDNVIIGNSGSNALSGGNGNDTLDGGTSNDALTGGQGNDIYFVDNTGDTTVETSGQGTDVVNSTITWTLATNVENLILLGAANIDAIGNSAVNSLTGNSGNNTLNGMGGVDVMAGGAGNDTYVVDATTETVTEQTNEGTDLVQSTATFTLGSNVENLTLMGSTAINGTGNGLDNVLTGNSGNNTLTGMGGNDTLDPGSGGTDTLVGGAGNDIYIVNRSTGVSITETSGNGVDTISTNLTTTLGSTTDIELLFLTGTTAINGTGNALNNLIRGNAMNNTLAGAAGVDILEGGALNDTLSDSGGITLFNGGSGTDTITSGATNDLLIGGTGNDALTTGSGADLIVFNKGDGVDTVAASTTKDNTVSIGGGALYADLLFQKSGNDLILKVGASDQITFTGYYTSTSNRSVNKLQIVIEGTTDYDAGSSDTTRNEKIETFNFDGLVAAFDAALIATPSLTTWALTNALAAQYLSGSDTAALGGDLAYRYNRFGTLSDISYTPAIGILNGSGFGTTAQNLQSLTSLQDASARLS